jgi:hypothetical protein
VRSTKQFVRREAPLTGVESLVDAKLDTLHREKELLEKMTREQKREAMFGVTSRSSELWCRIVLNTLPSRTDRSSCAWSWTRSWSGTGELMLHYNIPLSRPAPPKEEKVSTNFDLCNARHDPGQILTDGQITPHQLLQSPQPMFAVIHRLQLAAAQQFR